MLRVCRRNLSPSNKCSSCSASTKRIFLRLMMLQNHRMCLGKSKVRPLENSSLNQTSLLWCRSVTTREATSGYWNLLGLIVARASMYWTVLRRLNVLLSKLALKIGSYYSPNRSKVVLGTNKEVEASVRRITWYRLFRIVVWLVEQANRVARTRLELR